MTFTLRRTASQAGITATAAPAATAISSAVGTRYQPGFSLPRSKNIVTRPEESRKDPITAKL